MANNLEVAGSVVIPHNAWESLGLLLDDRSGNIANFVQEALELVVRVGSLQCRLQPPAALMIELGDGRTIELKTTRALGKLRAACANLAVRSQVQEGVCNVYGGSGVIRISENSAAQVAAQWINTPDRQEFTLTRIDPEPERS